MKRRLSANTWVLIVFTTVLAMVGIDIGRRALLGQPPADVVAEKPKDVTPPFKVGDPAPDFKLADASGKQRTLHELVQGDTLLNFSCGCASCRTVQTYLAQLQNKLGKDAPSMVSVTSSEPVTEEAWLRDTKLQQTVLYQPKGGKVIDDWKGHPCPRVFRITADRKIDWIGPSPADGKPLPLMGYQVARELGFELKKVKNARKPAPFMDDGSGMTPGEAADYFAAPPMRNSPGEMPFPPQPAPTAAALPPGHGPGDGHNH